jgi:hypothetical protein
MTDRKQPMSRDELRAALPDLAEFVDACRESFGDGVRVLGIKTADFTIGRPELDGDGIRLSQTTAAGNVCAPDLSEPAAPARRRR